MSSDSVNGSSPNVSSSRVTTIAIARESSPESSKTKPSVRGGKSFLVSLPICWICEMTADLIDISILDLSAAHDRVHVCKRMGCAKRSGLLRRSGKIRLSNDISDQRLQEPNSLKEVCYGFARVVRQRHLRFQSAEEFLRMSHVADAVHVRIFLLHRALPL